jgi:hypothetical protein
MRAMSRLPGVRIAANPSMRALRLSMAPPS